VAHLVGVISDTHGLLRPEAVAALDGCELIVHAGDVGSPEVLGGLSAIAPVRAVRGNNDRGAWARRLPETDRIEIGGVALFLLHDAKLLDFDPAAAGIAAVIFGHSHKPGHARTGGVLRFNPGSAGPRRFRLPVSLGRLHIRSGTVEPELITLAV
jgi:putative phosphoesterase